MIFFLNDFNGGSLSVCDYLAERIKRETKKKSIQQCGYLIVKGIVKRKGGEDLFRHLDLLFDIPQEEKKVAKSKEELIDEFKEYVGGA